MNSREGARVITTQAYLPAGTPRPNLRIMADTEVDNTLFEGSRAAGVRLVDGAVIGAGCVVLAAGTYGSPSILLRSGVGPPDHLRSVDIEVRVGLRGVGENLGSDVGVDVDCGYQGDARDSPSSATSRHFTAASPRAKHCPT